MSSAIAFGQPPDRAEVLGPVGGERPLRHERAVVAGLHALHAVDPEPVVPLLHPRQQIRPRVLRNERAGACTDVLALRRARNPGDEIGQCLTMQHRVGVDADHERRLDLFSAVLSAKCLPCFASNTRRYSQPSRPAASAARFGRSVRGVVVRQDHLDRSLLGDPGDSFESRDDRLLLVQRRDQNRHRGPLARGQRPPGRDRAAAPGTGSRAG